MAERVGDSRAELHQYTRERNTKKVEKLLKKGVEVDCVNEFGQTPLFCAALLGVTNVAELLLHFGADPNHRCDDRSTPVHAAVFSCNAGLLSSLLKAGGDLRLHDDRGRTPRNWLEAGTQEHRLKMLRFLKRCESDMRSMIQTTSSQNECVTPTSSKTLLHNLSLLKLLTSGDSYFNVNKPSLRYMVQCYGYGKLCIGKPKQLVGLMASVPLIFDSELAPTKDEAPYSFTCGSFSRMTNYTWKGCWVTVKEQQQNGCLDLLITELEYCCHLFHPHLLQLMAVSMSSDLQQSRLVYERVHVGSLYSVLHRRRAELQKRELLAVMLQVCEALLYLHGRALVLRALSSHSVLIVHPGVAKVTDLGFMVPSEGSCLSNVCPLSLPLELYNWAAPEVIRGCVCTVKADLYSVCAIIQELYTGTTPWGSVDSHFIKQAVQTGHALFADPAVPQPYYDLLQSGLQSQPQDRTSSINDLQYILHADLKDPSCKKLSSTTKTSVLACGKEIKQRQRKRSEELFLVKGLGMQAWNRSEVPVKLPGVDGDSTVSLEIQDQVQYLDSLQEIKTEEETFQSFRERLQNDEVETSTCTEEHRWDLSYHNSLNLEECVLPQWPPLAETTRSEDLSFGSSSFVENMITCRSSFTSEHINSIVLNLKVSRVLLRQIESSLAKTELMMEQRSDQLHTGVCTDEVDGLDRKTENRPVVIKAMGPPSSTYRPLLQLQKTKDRVGGVAECELKWGANVEEEPSWYYSAGDESYMIHKTSHIAEAHFGITLDHLLATHPVKTIWTSEISEMTAPMMQDRLRSSAETVESSDSEIYDCSHSNQSAVCACEEYAEQLMKSSSSEDPEIEETADSDKEDSSDYIESPVEPSSMFYTLQQYPSSTHTTKEQSQISSVDDLHITVEVCLPVDSQALKVKECQATHEESDQTAAVRGPLTTRQMQDLFDIAELSSITCSSALHKEWIEHSGASPSPHSRCFPPCSSTPCTQDSQGKTEKVEAEDEEQKIRETCASVHTDFINFAQSAVQLPAPSGLVVVSVHETNLPDEEKKEYEEQLDAEQDKEAFEKILAREQPQREDTDPAERGQESNVPIQTTEKNQSSNHPDFVDKTTRAHSTLDEALQAILLGEKEIQKPFRGSKSVLEGKILFCKPEEIREDSGCSAEDSNKGAAWREA